METPNKTAQKIIDLELEKKYAKIQKFLSQQQGMTLDLQSMIYLVGLREWGQLRPVSKEEKLDLMHIGTCRLLEIFGYYKFIGWDQEAWPHFEKIQDIPYFNSVEQERLLKETLVIYFEQFAV